MALSNNDDLDTGISYRASTPNLQKLLDKVKARKRAAGEGTSDRNGMIMNYRAMSSKLDDLIEFSRGAYAIPALGEDKIRRMARESGRSEYFIHRALKKAPNAGEHLDQIPVRKEAATYIKDMKQWLKKYSYQSRGVKLSSKLDDLIQFADPRPRNNLGEFSPQDEGGPDPNAMVKTYRIAPNQPGMAPNKNQGPGLAGIAGLGLVGGAAGATGAEAAKGAGRGLHALARKLGYIKK